MSKFENKKKNNVNRTETGTKVQKGSGWAKCPKETHKWYSYSLK